MARYVRWRERGARYFFTLVTYRRRPLFRDEAARKLLHQTMETVRDRRPFDEFARVVLPDHLHCLWTLPDDDDDFPVRWRQIKAAFTRRYLHLGGPSLSEAARRRSKRYRGVWQPRYWEHRIRNEDEWYAYRDYIHLNPVKHGYVEDPRDWPWSSVHHHLKMGWLSENWESWSPIAADAARE